MCKFLDNFMFVVFIIMMSGSAFEEWVPKSKVSLLTYGYFLIRILAYLYKSKGIKINVPIILVLGFLLASCMWSFNILESLQQAFYLTIQTIIIIFVGRIRDFKFVLSRFYIAGLVIAIASFIAVQVDPVIATNQDNSNYRGLWEGVFFHKNSLADTMCFYILINVFYITLIKNKIKRGLIVTTILVEFYLLIKSGSTTGSILLIIIFLFYFAAYVNKQFKFTYLKASIGTFLLTGTLYLAFSILLSIGKVFAFFGKDTTATGRDQIWSFSIDMIKEHLIFGYGYRSTFIAGSDFYNAFVSRFNVNSLHSGYLEYVSYFGLIGVVLIIPLIFQYLNLAFKGLKEIKLINYLPIAFFIYLSILNLTESAFIGSSNVMLWIFLVYLFEYMKFKKSESHSEQTVS